MDPRRPPPRITKRRTPESEPDTGEPGLKRVKENLTVFYNELVLPTGTYRYSPLGPNEIRLLHLFPADSVNDLIQTELKVARLDDPAMEYEALSYVWGHDEPTEKMWIQSSGQETPQSPTESPQSRSAMTPKERFRAVGWNVASREREKNKTFYVRPNLDHALRHLRDYPGPTPQQSRRAQQTLVIWIDSICIDQGNKDEKSAQVKMMADIYKRADSVFIWLGRESEDSTIGMDFVLRIPDQEHQGMLSVRASDAHQWAAFMALMRRAWFSRRWVVQELAMAKKAYLRCGNISVNWVDFVVAVEFFIERFDTIAGLYTDSPIFQKNVLALGDIRASVAPKMVTITNEFVRGRERLKSLEALVSELTMFEAGDPRDTVYAVVALAKDIEEGSERQLRNRQSEETSSPSFKVDYRKNVLQVFTEFVAFCIHGSEQLGQQLDIICRKWAPNRRAKRLSVADRARYRGRRPPLEEIHLPSWIGLLKDSAYGIPHAGPQARVAGNSLVDSSLTRGYHASGRRKVEVKFGETNGNNNHGEKSEVGSVTRVLKLIYDVDDRALDLRRNDLAANPSDFKVSAQELLEIGRNRKSDGTMYAHGYQVACIQQISHRLYEGMIPYEWLQLGGWRQRSYEDEEANDIPEELWRTLVANRTPEGKDPPQRYLVALTWAIERHNSNNDINTAELIRQGQPEEMVKFLKRVQEVIWNRRFFLLPDRTDGVAYRFGIAPTDAKVGDIVCVLLGCSVPVVLSPLDATNINNGYRVVGEAYLHGVMDGEVLMRETSVEFCLV